MSELAAIPVATSTRSRTTLFAKAAIAALVLASLSALADASAATTTTTTTNTSWVDHLTSLNASRWTVDSGWSNGSWQINDWLSSQITYSPTGMVATLNKDSKSPSGYASGEIQAKAFVKYGYFEARIQAASGAGLDTGFFTYTGTTFGAATNNEIDVELLGKNTRQVQLTYHNGAGQVSVPLNLTFDAAAAPHLYAFDWEPTYIKWYIDNKLVLTQTGSKLALPTEPQKLYFDLWGSDSSGQAAWMGSFKWAGHAIATEVACMSYAPSYTGKTVC